jgi:phage terminase small subunit
VIDKRNPDRIKAEKIYLEHKGNIELIKIAEMLGRPPGTIRGWKNKDNWDDKLDGTFQEKKRNVPKDKKNIEAKRENKIIDKLEDAELTEKQRLFCLYYVKSFNATQSAIKAGYSKDTAHVIGHENLRKPNIAAEIRRLKGSMTQDIFIDAMDVLRKYAEIAFADVTDYMEFGQKEVQVMSAFGPILDEDGEPVTKLVNYVDLKESNEVDGTILSEVSQGKDGIKVKLLDKMKALEKLELYFDLLPDKFKRQLEEEKLKLQKDRLHQEEEYKKVQIDKLKAQTEKIKGISDDIEDTSELRKLLGIDE